MPYIDLKTTAEITLSQEEKLKSAFGEDICALPGKSEHWLMVNMADNCRMYFRGGRDEPIAMVEISLFGASTESAYAELTSRVTKTVSSVLSIPSDRIYVKYSEISTWGFDGENF